MIEYNNMLHYINIIHNIGVINFLMSKNKELKVIIGGGNSNDEINNITNYSDYNDNYDVTITHDIKMINLIEMNFPSLLLQILNNENTKSITSDLNNLCSIIIFDDKTLNSFNYDEGIDILIDMLIPNDGELYILESNTFINTHKHINNNKYEFSNSDYIITFDTYTNDVYPLFKNNNKGFKVGKYFKIKKYFNYDKYKPLNYIQIVQNKKRQIFERHNKWIEHMKTIILPSGNTISDICIASLNEQMGNTETMDNLYKKWLPWAQNIGYKNDTKALEQINNKQNLIYYMTKSMINMRSAYYYDNLNNKIMKEIPYELKILDFIDMFVVSKYKPIAYCHDVYLYPEMQQKLLSDDYYITESTAAYFNDEKKFTHLQVAYVPAVINFMILNKEFKFMGKLLNEYNVIELLDKMANAPSQWNDDIQVFLGLYSDLGSVKNIIKITNDQKKLVEHMKTKPKILYSTRNTCILELCHDTYPIINKNVINKNYQQKYKIKYYRLKSH